MNPSPDFNNPHRLEACNQRLLLLPSTGGSVAAWQWLRGDEVVDLWRPWDGRTRQMKALASYPLLPWCNRISGGGFEHAGRFHPLRPNTPDDPYPIHGDGWQQAWALTTLSQDSAAMSLHSDRFGGSPYVYDARQTFALRDGGMQQTLSVTNRGPDALPFGLGQHPWFGRTPDCRLIAGVEGVWMSRPDRLPTGYTSAFPAGWDLNTGARVDRLVIDNGFGGWNGQVFIEWPERALALRMRSHLVMPDGAQVRPDCLLYAPAEPPVFCFEPVSHPIDAAHLEGQPGWVDLQPGATLRMETHWTFSTETRP